MFVSKDIWYLGTGSSCQEFHDESSNSRITRYPEISWYPKRLDMLDIHAFERASWVHSRQISDFGQHHDGFGKPKLDVSRIFCLLRGSLTLTICKSNGWWWCVTWVYSRSETLVPWTRSSHRNREKYHWKCVPVKSCRIPTEYGWISKFEDFQFMQGWSFASTWGCRSCLQFLSGPFFHA